MPEIGALVPARVEFGDMASPRRNWDCRMVQYFAKEPRKCLVFLVIEMTLLTEE